MKECCGSCAYWYCGKCNFYEEHTDVLSVCSKYKLWRRYI